VIVVYTVPALEVVDDETEDEFRYTTSALGLGAGKSVVACLLLLSEVVIFLEVPVELLPLVSRGVPIDGAELMLELASDVVTFV